MSASAENVYDVIVVGMGPVGETLAERARAAGLSVAAVERELVGGECSYWACIPSKAMLRPVVAVGDARRVPLGPPGDRTPFGASRPSAKFGSACWRLKSTLPTLDSWLV
jgi:hypothetical protein